MNSADPSDISAFTPGVRTPGVRTPGVAIPGVEAGRADIIEI
jgi:hypothetical protein